MRKFVLWMTTLCLLTALAAPALAVAPWALDGLCEAESLEMLFAEDMANLEGTVTADKLAVITYAAATKLDRLIPAKEHTPLATAGDLTRGGVVNALYDVAYAFDEKSVGPVAFLTELGVIQGDQNGDLHLDRPCTLQEAFLFAQRLVLKLYDRADEGTRGLLWKVENEENTLYLYGTYHVDKGELYPFHQSVRSALTQSETLCMEIDFGDAAGVQEFMDLYYYPEGDGLNNYLPQETYAAAVETLASAGMDEATVNSMKVWAVGNALESLANQDETSGTVMVTDSYLYSKAICNGIPVAAVETYGFQGRMLDNLTMETQVTMVENGLKLFTEDSAQALEDLFTPWQTGDADGFSTVYGKDDVPEDAVEKELTDALLTNRDPAMADWCLDFLAQEGSNTATFAVGAGHMVGATGVVELLRQAGYTVEPVQ